MKPKYKVGQKIYIVMVSQIDEYRYYNLGKTTIKKIVPEASENHMYYIVGENTVAIEDQLFPSQNKAEAYIKSRMKK